MNGCSSRQRRIPPSPRRRSSHPNKLRCVTGSSSTASVCAWRAFRSQARRCWRRWNGCSWRGDGWHGGRSDSSNRTRIASTGPLAVESYHGRQARRRSDDAGLRVKTDAVSNVCSLVSFVLSIAFVALNIANLSYNSCKERVEGACRQDKYNKYERSDSLL